MALFNEQWHVVHINPKEVDILLLGRSRELRSADKVWQWAKAKKKEPLVVMNGGMFHKDHTPVGLFFDVKGLWIPLNKGEGKGNFFLKPNGGITWMPGVESSAGELSFEIPDIIPVPREDYFYHKAYPIDMDGDGDMDFVTSSYKNPVKDWFGNVTEPGIAVLEWFENDGIAGEASFTHHFISENGGTFVKAHDVDEDGDLDLVMPQYFGGASLVWLENPSSMT